MSDSGTKTTESTSPMADRVEDEVLEELPSLKIAELEGICDLIGFTVKTESLGKRKSVLKDLMVYLCSSSDEDDDKLTDFLQIHKHLGLEKEEEDADGDSSQVVKKEDAVEEVTAKEVVVTKPAELTENKSSFHESKDKQKKETLTPAKTELHAEIGKVKVKLKEFKLPGSAMIGGEGETTLSYNSLLFEVEKGRKLGYEKPEICAAIIPRVADKEMRDYFETTPDITLADVLEMLKNVCCIAEGSSTLFTQFTNDSQDEGEKPLTFITRVLRLRRQVRAVGLEEGVSYPQTMLMKRSHEVMIGGLRDENIRSALRERCKNDHTLDDKTIHKHASQIIEAEKERKKKLFGKKDEPILVQALGTKDYDESRQKKEKLNPFVEIERLRAEMRKETQEIKDMISTFKEEFLTRKDKNPPGKNDDQKQSARRRRKCKQCVTDGKFKCHHCWECGKDDHRISDCPEN